MSAANLLRLPSALGDLEIPYHVLGAPGRSPRVALVAGLQGDELNGVFVLARLAAYLRAVEAGEQRGRLKAPLLVVPCVNVAGVHAGRHCWPLDNTDINGMFPGNATGETTQRIAQAVLELTRDAYYRVDIHGSGPHLEELPQVWLFDPHDEERSTACQFGLAVAEQRADGGYAGSLYSAWRPWPGECFVLQAGLAGALQLPHCERLFRALVAFLQRTEILEGVELSEDEDLHYFGAAQLVSVTADQAGWFVSHLDVGRWLLAGEVIGQMYDGFAGSVLAEVRSPVSGLVAAIRRQPLTFEGEPLARIHAGRAAVAGGTGP